MATFNKFQSFVEALAEKVHDLDNRRSKVALSRTRCRSRPTRSRPTLRRSPPATATRPAARQATQVSSAQTSGTYKLVLNDVTFTATRGNIGPFQYVVLYNDTAADDELIGWYDYGTALTITNGNSFTVDFDAPTAC